jgi:hypothetical protein
MQSAHHIGRSLLLAAGPWLIAAGIYLLLTPMTVQEITASATAGGAQTTEQITRQVSWYHVQGLWGVFVLIVFAALYASISLFARRSHLVAAALASLAAITLTFLAGFSIGPFYLPATLAVLLGWLAMVIGRLVRPGGRILDEASSGPKGG